MKNIVDKRIKELMKEENVNQTQLGKAIGIDYRTVSSWIHGKTEPHIDDLWRSRTGLEPCKPKRRI